MSIVIDDLCNNAKISLNIFKSILQNKIDENINTKTERSLNLIELDGIITHTYEQSLNYIYEQIEALRDPPKWNSNWGEKQIDVVRSKK